MAVTASFSASTGFLTVFGDAHDNTITSAATRPAASWSTAARWRSSAARRPSPTPSLIQVFGQAGNDTITLNEANGALPAANLFGGAGNDTLTGGSGNDQLFGQAGNDTCSARAATTSCSAATATTP